MSAAFQEVRRPSELRNVVGRWLVFIFLFSASICLPFVLRIDHIPAPIFGSWMLWPFLALPSEGFTDSPTVGGAVYLQQASMYLAAAFWIFAGVAFAWFTRRLSIRYVFLVAYPAMLGIFFSTSSILTALGYYAVSSL